MSRIAINDLERKEIDISTLGESVLPEIWGGKRYVFKYKDSDGNKVKIVIKY